MTQPQLSVREKAREMFAVKYLLNDEISNIIDQIITLAQEEKCKEVEKIKDRFKCGACDGAKCEHTQSCQSISEVIEILKQ